MFQHFYIDVEGSPQKLSLPNFLKALDAALLSRRMAHPDEWIEASLHVAQSGQDPEITDPKELEAYKVILAMWKDSERLEGLYERKQGEKAHEKATRSERNALAELKALEDSQIAAKAIREETTLSISSRIEQIVGENFEVLKTGGLVPKKGAKLSQGDAWTLISSLTEMAQAGERMAQFSALSLGDALVEAERKFGESFDVTQIIEATGKTESLIRQARMVSKQFDAEERQKQDPEGRLTFSHWVEITGRKSLRKVDKAKLADAVARRGAPTRKVRELGSALEEVRESERGVLLKSFDEEKLSTDAALEATKKLLVLNGQPTGELPKWLYIFKETGELKVSNEFNNTFAQEGAVCVKWGTHPKWTTDGLHFNQIPFHRTAPDSLESDPIEQPEDEEPEYYGDFMISRAEEGFEAVGTLDGEAQALKISKARDIHDALRSVQNHFGLSVTGEGAFVDEQGLLYNLRTAEE